MKYLLPLALLTLTQCKSDKEAAGSPPPAMPIQVTHPITKTVAITETYTGRFTPIEEVDLQARVSGALRPLNT